MSDCLRTSDGFQGRLQSWTRSQVNENLRSIAFRPFALFAHRVDIERSVVSLVRTVFVVVELGKRQKEFFICVEEIGQRPERRCAMGTQHGVDAQEDSPFASVEALNRNL